jgi:hypothetical protein
LIIIPVLYTYMEHFSKKKFKEMDNWFLNKRYACLAVLRKTICQD